MNRALLLIAAAMAPAHANPLLTESKLPYHLPPFADIKDEHFAPAFERGMAEHMAEIDAIANNPAKPTFDNTIVALERAGELLGRARRVFNILNGALTNSALQKLDSDFAPRFARHNDSIQLNGKLFARIREVHGQMDALKLDTEARRLVKEYFDDAVRRGANLSDPDKERLKSINAELARLTSKFRQNVLAEVNASAVKTSSGVVKLENTTGQPALASIESAETRRMIMEASLARGTRGNEYDNRAVVVAIARKRAELAQLLGFPSFAALQLKQQTAATPEAVDALLSRIAGPAVANARREAAEMAKMADAPIAAGDWAFHAAKLRRARFALDEAATKPYYEIRRVLVDGVFFAASKLYGLQFRERRDLKGYSPDMYVFEVFNADGSALGLFLGDFYARPNKRGGAWANAYVPQSGLTGHKPVIGNHLNVAKPAAGPTLLTRGEANTMFHEFGHALHFLFGAVKYPGIAGVPRDFVEFPSQVNEMWATWPEVLENFAKHHQTGAPMPKDLLAKVLAADNFQQGYHTTEMVGASILDMAWHRLKPEEVPDDAVAFEASVLRKHGLDFALVPPRYRSTYFSHVFAGGYAAGYYSYLWSEVLDADTVEWFKQNGGLNRASGDRFRRMLLSRGGSEEAMDLYRAFRGGDPDPGPFLKRRALQ
jgi:peptidyl-dipeptidase Dcp